MNAFRYGFHRGILLAWLIAGLPCAAASAYIGQWLAMSAFVLGFALAACTVTRPWFRW